ncbi:TonB C-terminal domain-containing protein [Prosthecobacter sp.]|uniref:TonB C-terminal domain-containing protein n=1 Tax=Prosthecobacter sp. TaxID=1965333 RepID=UPI003784F3FF
MNRKRPTTLEPISAAVFVIVSLHLGAVFGVWWWWQNVGSLKRDARTSQLAWMNPGDFKSLVPASTAVPRAKAVASSKADTKPPAAAPKPAAEPPVQKATLIAAPPQQHQMEPVPNTTGTPLFAGTAVTPSKPSANRSITLRRALEKRPAPPRFGTPVPPMTNPTLMDIARLNTLRPAAISLSNGTRPATEEVDLDAVDEAVNAAFLIGWTAPPIESVPEGQREGRLNISIGKDGTVLKAQMNKFSGSHALDQSILETAAKVKKISTTLPSNYSKDSYDLELNFLLLP